MSTGLYGGEPKPSDRLEGKVAIVTGAGTRGEGVGVGRAIAIAFARAGARVCLVDREPENADATHAIIEREGYEGVTFVAAGDVSVGEDCMRATEATVSRYGRVDVLVNNAAQFDRRVPLHQMEAQLWDMVMATNAKGAMLMSKAVIPKLIDAGGGSVINISSVSAEFSGSSAAYDASKAAMSSLTRSVAVGYGRYKIRANTIAPGRVPSPMLDELVEPDVIEGFRRLTPLAIEASPWYIANAAVFLVSDEAAHISGVSLPIDGATTSQTPFHAYRLLRD